MKQYVMSRLEGNQDRESSNHLQDQQWTVKQPTALCNQLCSGEAAASWHVLLQLSVLQDWEGTDSLLTCIWL